LQSAAQLFKSQALAAGHLFADKQALGRMSDTGLLSAYAMWSSFSWIPYTYFIVRIPQSRLTRLHPTGYDLILRDAVMWPAALLEDLLGVPSVEVIPLPLNVLQITINAQPNLLHSTAGDILDPKHGAWYIALQCIFVIMACTVCSYTSGCWYMSGSKPVIFA